MTTFGLDPDPLDLSHHPAYVLGYEHGWTDAPRHPGGKLVVVPCADPACRFVAYHVFPPRPNRRLRALLVSVAIAAGLLVGIFIGRAVAAPWPGPQTTERVDVVRALSAGDRTRAPLVVWVVRL